MIIDSASGHGRAALPKAAQLILDFEPGNLVLRPDMIVRVHSLWFIETTQGNLNPVAEHFFMHGKRASADRAKAAFRVFRGSISCRLAFDPFKGIDRKMDKSQHWRSGVLSTHRAVANYGAKRRCGGAIADCPAKTSSFKCDGTDQGVSEGIFLGDPLKVRSM